MDPKRAYSRILIRNKHPQNDMMTIKQIEVTVGDITKGYVNNDEQGVRGYDGLLRHPPTLSARVYL